MLYDEDGNPYVEPALLPDDVRLQYIVKDYQRMFREYNRMETANKKMEAKMSKMYREQIKNRRYTARLVEVLRHCMKHMKQNKLAPTKFIEDFLQENLLNK